MKIFSRFRNPISLLASRFWPEFALAVNLSLFLAPANLHAQPVSRINGEGTDQAAAVVPEAQVTVTNVDPNVSHTTSTTSPRPYLALALIPAPRVGKIVKCRFQT